ncbi:MAG: FHA domain-containing protein [Oscillospiraceae bacterium]|nr:FHA domain-containing protein [Oscillospiraceae bacterium]
MRTVVKYLDKNNKQVNKEEAWTVETKVYNDAGNLQRTGYSIGDAQKRANAASAAKLILKDVESGKEYTFEKTNVKAGREAPCDLIIAVAEKKKIDKVHAVFELRVGQWYVTDLSKGGTYLNGTKLANSVPNLLNSGDIIDFAGKKKFTFGG